MPRLPLSSSSSRAEATTCGSLLRELQDIWNEIGEDDFERDRMILQIEQECLELYRKKVDQTRKHKAELHRMLAQYESEISNLISALGERETFVRLEKPTGTLNEQLVKIKPTLEDLRQKKEERIKAFQEIQSQIARIYAEIAGNADLESSASSQVDERDLTLKRLEELKCQLHVLQTDKNLRLQKVDTYIKTIHDMSKVLSVDSGKTICEVHPSFGDSAINQTKSISNSTLAKLSETVHSLKEDKMQRLQKLQALGRTFIELWNLMETPIDERRRFDHITCLISTSVDSEFGQGSLSLEVIEQAEVEAKRLNVIKASKMKEIVLKKQNELYEIYRSVRMDYDVEGARQMLINLIDSGKADLSELLSSMDNQIAKAQEQALSRRDILEKVDKWKFASEEEKWLDDYEKDGNRYSAGRGVHKSLKRAEKARVLVNKMPALVENLTAKIKAWENEKGIPFMYEKVRLLDSLDEYIRLRQQRQEEKRRSREQKKLQEQFATEQEALFGSKPSPLRQFPVKKPLGQSSIANMACETPGRRVSTPFGRPGMLSSGKDKKLGKWGKVAITPVNYVSLPKDDAASRNNSFVSP